MLRNPSLLGCIEVLTVGLPFCIFKVLAGLLAGPWGYPLLALGACDLALNGANLISLVFLKRRVVPICTLELLFGRTQRQEEEARREMTAALDVALSFLIVAVVIGGNFLKRFPPLGMQLWSAAVVLNVLGAGMFQVNQAYAKLKA